MSEQRFIKTSRILLFSLILVQINTSFFFPVLSPPVALSNGYGSNSPLTPSARISALNIVSDLLRKVGVSHFFSELVLPGFRSPFLFHYHVQRYVESPCLSVEEHHHSLCLHPLTGSGVQARRLQELCQGPESEEGVRSRQQQRAQRKHSQLLAVAPHVIF